MSNGKGSKTRPLSVSAEEYGNRFDRIFGSRHSVSEELPWLVPPPATPKDRTLQEEWNRLMREPIRCKVCGAERGPQPPGPVAPANPAGYYCLAHRHLQPRMFFS